MRFLLLTLAAIAAVAPASARDRNVPPPATPAGAPVDCVRLSDLRETRVHGDQVIDFVTRGGKVYRNTLPYACSRLGFEERFSYTVSTGRLCSVDTITVLDSSGIRGPSCGLGQFQPVSIAK